MPMFTVSIIFELIQCLLIKNLPLSSAIFGETAELLCSGECFTEDTTLCKIY